MAKIRTVHSSDIRKSPGMRLDAKYYDSLFQWLLDHNGLPAPEPCTVYLSTKSWICGRPYLHTSFPERAYVFGTPELAHEFCKLAGLKKTQYTLGKP